MKFNCEHLLSSKNYDIIESIKKQIVLGNTFNRDMKHVIGWKHRYNGEYKKTASFTIDVNGIIYKHFDPKYQSKFFNDLTLDSKSIVILLENDGWLTKNDKNNSFISWLGHIYNESDTVYEKKWRGYSYWAPYNKKQMDSTVKLVKYLCDEFYIPIAAMTHNTKVEYLEDYNGIVYRSNIEKDYTDVNPSFDFEYFVDNINKNDNNYERKNK